MSTPSAPVRAPSTLDSDLPVVVFAPATPQIDSDAPPELDSRVSRGSAEPIANPARARTVEGAAPMAGRETAAPTFYVPFEVFHSLDSNSAPANAAPDLPDQVAISTERINARCRACIDLTLDSDVEINIVTTDSEDRANGATTVEEDNATEDDGEAHRAEQRRILVEREIFCAQPRDDDEVEPPQWPLEQVVVVFGVEGIFEAIRGRKPRPEVKPRHSKRFWYQVARAPKAGSSSAHFKDRYPVRRGRAKRDLGPMRELHSDNCEDESAEEEPKELDGMIDDTDSEEGYIDFATMLAREREAEQKAAEVAEKKAAKAAAKKAAKRAKKEDNILFEMDEALAYGWEMRDA